MNCVFAGDRYQRIDLKTNGGLVLRVTYDQGVRAFSGYVAKRSTPSELARGKPDQIVCHLTGQPHQLPGTVSAEGALVFRLGTTTVELHPASKDPLNLWLNQLNRLLIQAAAKEVYA